MFEIRPESVRIVAVELSCPNCGQETRHSVHYVAQLLRRLECEHCGHRWEVSHRWLLEQYLHAFPHRIASKPMRLARQARRHPLAFLASLPARVLTKPGRVADEVGTVTGILDE